jgi:thiosulfate dehydrogenase
VFVEKTRHGGFLGYGGTMPPFSLNVLSDEDLADLLTFLRLP